MLAWANLTAPDSANGPVLRDIHLPSEPAWWPPAPGWWLLAGLVVLLLCLGAWQLRRWWRVVRGRQHVLAEVARLRERHQRDHDDAALAGDLHQLLRRVARAQDPAAVQQQGDAWRATLARVPVEQATLRHLLLLEQAMYRADVPFDSAGALAAVVAWLQLALRPRKWKRAVATHA